ncbi:MAG: diguanylate cyclase [Acidobacteriia bacterium]|nr:diguanylate cyclase [Terriglobia bacterium]
MFKWITLGFFLGLLFTAFKVRELYRRNKQLSRTDSKTGALSERGFIEALGDESRRSRRNLRPLTVAYIDLDNFRLVNRILGYSGADEVLRVVARTMQNTLREVDFVARLHGDEFALLLPETGAEDAPLVLGKLQKALRKAMAVSQWPVTFSIGAVSFNNPLATPDSMIEATANVMQSSAKQGGKDRIQHLEFESRDKPEYLVECLSCRTSFIATSHPFCPFCGNAALSDSQPAQTEATESKRVAGICAFRLPLDDGKTIEFHGPSDITKEQVEAIVSAANSSLTGSGGVDKAIHRAGGPSILTECRRLAASMGRLPAGKAVLTAGGSLPAKHVIHTVGPFYRDGSRGEAEILASCYHECIRLSDTQAITSLAFPSISTGAHGYPVGEAARIAVSAVADALGATTHLSHVRFVLFDERTLGAYVAAAEEFALLKSPASMQDQLTGLPSRRRLFADLDRLLQDPEQRFALMLMDLDDFKKVNDEYGHLTGDNELRALAQVLSNRAPTYRHGGDEFVAVSPCAERPDALILAESIRADVARLVFEDHPELRLTIGVGVAVFPEDGNTMDELLRSADAAVYEAKRNGGNCVKTCRDRDAKTA